MLFAVALLLAQPPAEDTYENDRLNAVLAAEHFARVVPRDDERIHFVRVVRHEVFTADDPWPDLLNAVHWLTDDDVVRRELLFHEGDRFDGAVAEESARNLRDLLIFSLVRIVPVRNLDGAFGVLVFTRDLWSLRLEQGFQVTGTDVDRLTVQLTERNILGRGVLAAVRFHLVPLSFSAGEEVLDRRVLGSPFTLGESFDLVFNSKTDLPEGSIGELVFGQPLRDLDQAWGFDLDITYNIGVARQLQGGAAAVYDVPETPSAESIPRVYDSRDVRAVVEATRQIPGAFEQRLTAGVVATSLDVAPNAETGPLDAVQRAAFARDVLPATRRVIGPQVRYEGFTRRFHIFENLDTFGQSEPVRLGPAISVTANGGLKSLLSSSDTVLLDGAAGIADRIFDDGLYQASFESVARLEDGRVVNRTLALRLRAATSPFLYGRLFTRAEWTVKKDDVTNNLVTLGGDNGLRGFPSQAFAAPGASLVQVGAEWRTAPVDWESIQVGLVGFYDGGALYLDEKSAAFHQSVGLGVRLLFPQFNRTPYCFDVGFPLDGGGFTFLFEIGDAQVGAVSSLPAVLTFTP